MNVALALSYIHLPVSMLFIVWRIPVSTSVFSHCSESKLLLCTKTTKQIYWTSVYAIALNHPLLKLSKNVQFLKVGLCTKIIESFCSTSNCIVLSIAIGSTKYGIVKHTCFKLWQAAYFSVSNKFLVILYNNISHLLPACFKSEV